MGILLCVDTSNGLPATYNELLSLVNNADNVRVAVDYDQAISIIARYTFEGCVFSGHSDESGFQFSGQKLSIDEIVTLLSLLDAEWVFFNSCSSESFVSRVKSQLDISIIATKHDVEDAKAARVTAALISAISATNGNIAEAVERAKIATSDSEYVFYEAARSAKMSRDDDSEQLRREIRELTLFVFGDEKLGIYGIKKNLEKLRDNDNSQKFWNRINTALALFLIMLEILRTFK